MTKNFWLLKCQNVIKWAEVFFAIETIKMSHSYWITLSDNLILRCTMMTHQNQIHECCRPKKCPICCVQVIKSCVSFFLNRRCVVASYLPTAAIFIQLIETFRFEHSVRLYLKSIVGCFIYWCHVFASALNSTAPWLCFSHPIMPMSKVFNDNTADKNICMFLSLEAFLRNNSVFCRPTHAIPFKITANLFIADFIHCALFYHSFNK